MFVEHNLGTDGQLVDLITQIKYKKTTPNGVFV